MILLAYLIAAIVRVYAWLTTHRWTTTDQRAFQRECANTGGPR